MKLTKKQVDIILTMSKMEQPDLDQILESIPYETTKESFVFSMRAMINKDLIKKEGLVFRRGKQRRLISLTETGIECAKRFVL